MPAPRSTGMPGLDAQTDFQRARRRATLAALAARLRGEPDDVRHVLPYEEVVAAGRSGRRDDSEQVAIIDSGFDGVAEVLQESRRRLRPFLLDAADLLVACFSHGGKALVCGNGGSAAEAQHFAANFLSRFRLADRPGLPAVALTADAAFLTAWTNEVGYESVFARQVEALGQAGDVLIGLSADDHPRNSGDRPSVRAQRAGRSRST